MYESAMELGVMSAKSPESTQNAKSFAVRNLAKSDWKTPQIQRYTSIWLKLAKALRPGHTGPDSENENEND